MANEKNLIPLDKRGKEEAKRIRQAGQKAQKAAQRERKTFRQIAEVLLDMEVTDSASIKKLKKMGVDEGSMSYKTLCMLGIIFEAQSGNVRAFEKLQELTGEIE